MRKYIFYTLAAIILLVFSVPFASATSPDPTNENSQTKLRKNVKSRYQQALETYRSERAKQLTSDREKLNIEFQKEHLNASVNLIIRHLELLATHTASDATLSTEIGTQIAAYENYLQAISNTENIDDLKALRQAIRTSWGKYRAEVAHRQRDAIRTNRYQTVIDSLTLLVDRVEQRLQSLDSENVTFAQSMASLSAARKNISEAQTMLNEDKANSEVWGVMREKIKLASQHLKDAVRLSKQNPASE